MYNSPLFNYNLEAAKNNLWKSPMKHGRLLSRGSTSAPEEVPPKSASAKWKASDATWPKPAGFGGSLDLRQEKQPVWI